MQMSIRLHVMSRLVIPLVKINNVATNSGSPGLTNVLKREPLGWEIRQLPTLRRHKFKL